VLDNCEHVLDAAAAVADTIARECPEVTLLATSREGLAVAGEQIVAVRSLGVPDDADRVEVLESVEAVRLFCDRAHDVNREFALTDRNAPAVAQLCRRLDGIPLAIELAAARARSLSPEELVSRLDQRFKLLTRGSRAALERHQTLRNMIDWSYNLLAPEEQEGLCRLSVFVGGCTLDAAEAILGDDAIDVLAQLVEKSLAIADEDEFGTRYRLLETIRQYAQERLEETEGTGEVRLRHAEHFIAQVEAARPGLRGREQVATATRLARDTENLRAALDWAIEAGSADHALRLLAPIAMTSTSIGWSAMAWSAAACDIPGAETDPNFPHVCAMAALDAAIDGQNDKHKNLVARAEQAASEQGVEVSWLYAARGAAANFSGDWKTTVAEGAAWVAIGRASNDAYEIAHALVLQGSGLAFSDTPSAVPTLAEAVEVARTSGIPSILEMGLMMLAVSLPPEQSGQAAALLEEAAELGAALGDRYGAANALSMRSRVALDAEDWTTALAAADASMQGLLALGQRSGFTGTVFVGGWACARRGEPEPAAVLFGFVASRHDFFVRDQEHRVIDELNAEIDRQLGEARAEELRARGAAMDGSEVATFFRATVERIERSQA
jgi:predicted ATPase